MPNTRYTIRALSAIFFMICSSVSAFGQRTPNYPPPKWATESSQAKTRFWSVGLSMKTVERTAGIWKMSYQIIVPEKQLQETPVLFPFFVGPAMANKSHYWMVQLYTVRWINPAGKVILSLTNTSDKSVDVGKVRFEAAKVPGVTGSIQPFISKGRINPGQEVKFTLFDIQFPLITAGAGDTTPVTFRLIDLPLSVNPDGTVREIGLSEDQFSVIRRPHTMVSGLSFGTINHFPNIVPGPDGSAHILDIEKSKYGKDYVHEVFLPIKLDFKVELEGKPLVGPDKIPWVQRQMNQPHDFGTPERSFPYGVPDSVVRAK